MRLITNEELVAVGGGLIAVGSRRVVNILDGLGRAAIIYDAVTYSLGELEALYDWYNNTYSGGADGWTMPNRESLPT